MDVINFILNWHLLPYPLGFSLMYFCYGVLTPYSYSTYWHCMCSHKYFTIAPWLQHIFRFQLWLTTSIWYQGHLTKFTAEHVLHHRHHDQMEGDPFNPRRYTLLELWTYEQREGAARYVSPEDVEKYGDPSVEPNDPASMFYKRHQFKGWILNSIIWGILMGPIGVVYGYLMQYAFQYIGTFMGDWLWHRFGYKPPNPECEARNIFPWCITTEGLHGNHHKNPHLANRRIRWFELDLFYWSHRLMAVFGWVKFNKQRALEK